MANPVEVKKDIVTIGKKPESGRPGRLGVENLGLDTKPDTGRETILHPRSNSAEAGDPIASRRRHAPVTTPHTVVVESGKSQPAKALKSVTPAEVVSGMLAESGFDQAPQSHGVVVKLGAITYHK